MRPASPASSSSRIGAFALPPQPPGTMPARIGDADAIPLDATLMVLEPIGTEDCLIA